MKNGLTLLYVEDNETVRENFTLIFSSFFENIITAENGQEALDLYRANDIDIAILDISIPLINGLVVAEKIRENDTDIEIIMLTAYSDMEKLLKAMNLHLFYYLVKPVDKDDLFTLLNRCIEKMLLKNTIQLAYNYSYNVKTQTLHYKEEPIKVSKNEKKLITFLCKNSSSYYSACDISANVFNVSSDEDTVCNNVIQLISRFKKKMLKSHNSNSFFIDNIYGLGYKIIL